jgi:hypothetical protein
VPGCASHADWIVEWKVPKLSGGGLVISGADFRGETVMWEGSAPFALVDYHDNSPIFKDGLNPAACGAGLEFAALVPTAPNRPDYRLPPGSRR